MLTKDDLIHKVLDKALLDPKSGQSKASVDGLLHYIQKAGMKDITKGDIIKHAKTMAGIKIQGNNLISDIKEETMNEKKLNTKDIKKGSFVTYTPIDGTKQLKGAVQGTMIGPGGKTFLRIQDKPVPFANIVSIMRESEIAEFYLPRISDLEKAKGLAKLGNPIKGRFAGWIAGYNGKTVEIKKSEAKDLYRAKQLAIKQLKVPNSKTGLLWIKPAVDESVNEATKRSVGKLMDSMAKLAKEMKDIAGQYTKAKAKNDATEMKKHISKLKTLTKERNTLQAEMDKAIGGLDKDVELVAQNESVLRSLIRNKIRRTLSEQKKYKVGDKYSSDFDYDGMLTMGTKSKVSDGIKKLKKLAASFTDVNYHTESKNLGFAIEALESGDKASATSFLKQFNNVCDRALNENTTKKPLLENKVNSVVDDVFFTWDEFIDDDRNGIEQGVTTHNGKRATQISFDTNNRQGLADFTRATVKLLKKSGVKYNWIKSELYIIH